MSQWYKIGSPGRRREGWGALNLSITSFAGNSERQSFLVGLAMIGLGVAARLKWVGIMDQLPDNFRVASWIFIVIGAIVFVIAFFGCCGAIRESHCMVVTYLTNRRVLASLIELRFQRFQYAIFLLVLIIVQVAVAVLLFVYSKDVESVLRNTVASLYHDSRTNDIAKATFNDLETQFGCCGDVGPQDYVINVPPSCCTGGVVQSTTGLCTAFNANPGCGTVIVEGYQKWSKVIGAVAIGVACTEVIGALFALCLANSIRNMDRRSRY
ncbi:CD63 antigen [Eumeta japonica]|uniref:Tetraspanin n=1 Tax=Eumeta variegata TaxID=151549 RepID=A0A4C1UJR9_EUMVA|nr:CD63 antigen [Eumeta japonica]